MAGERVQHYKLSADVRTVLYECYRWAIFLSIGSLQHEQTEDMHAFHHFEPDLLLRLS